MKKLFAISLALSVLGPLVSGQTAAPAVKIDGSITTGLNCFVPLQDKSQKTEFYAFDNPLNGMDTPFQAIVGFTATTAPNSGLSIHISNGYNVIPAGTNQANSFQLWDGYAWSRFGNLTLEAGQLNENDFRSWVDCQSYIARDKFGSVGVAVKYTLNTFNAIAEVPGFVPGASSNQNIRWNSANDPGVGGLDGTMESTLDSLYLVANYAIPKLAGVQLGYQGQGLNAAGYSNGADLWADIHCLGIDRLTAYLEWEGWNIGQLDTAGDAVTGLAYNAFALFGWRFDAFTVQNDFAFLQGNTSAVKGYNLRLQPSLIYPVNGMLTAILTARVDNVAGKFLSSQNTGKPSFWINPEFQLALGGNQLAFGFYIGNDYTGGAGEGGSWFFGNTKLSTPGYDRTTGTYTTGSPKAFIDPYVSFVYHL
jgi:hypothetical protein